MQSGVVVAKMENGRKEIKENKGRNGDKGSWYGLRKTKDKRKTEGRERKWGKGRLREKTEKIGEYLDFAHTAQALTCWLEFPVTLPFVLIWSVLRSLWECRLAKPIRAVAAYGDRFGLREPETRKGVGGRLEEGGMMFWNWKTNRRGER